MNSYKKKFYSKAILMDIQFQMDHMPNDSEWTIYSKMSLMPVCQHSEYSGQSLGEFPHKSFIDHFYSVDLLTSCFLFCFCQKDVYNTHVFEEILKSF